MSDTIAILTALNLEYQAVREKLTDLTVHRHPAGTRFEMGRLRGGTCPIALALVGKGNHPSAVLAERVIAEFTPAAVIFVGVAGSLWSQIALGDIVVATHVYAYHGATSEDDGLKARPRVWEISHSSDQIARHLERAGTWRQWLPADAPPPAVHFGPIRAGEVVQDSTISTHARWVKDHYNDALAVEMEAAGVAQAGHLNNSLPVVVVRGISDMADGSKATSDGKRWQPTAAANAAAFAAALAEEMHVENSAAEASRPRRSTEMGATNTNIATGNARVGLQANQISGGVRIGLDLAAPPELAAEIAALRDRLKRANIAGEVDDATFEAAQAELDVVTQHLSDDAAADRGKVVVALKRLRGLVNDVADLATKVAAIISSVRSAW
jgi:adenosylhomocysteine nucleosidase